MSLIALWRTLAVWLMLAGLAGPALASEADLFHGAPSQHSKAPSKAPAKDPYRLDAHSKLDADFYHDGASGHCDKLGFRFCPSTRKAYQGPEFGPSILKRPFQ